MKHNWWVWSAHLSDAKVESIIKKCESLDKLSGTVRGKDKNHNEDLQVRQSEISWVDDDEIKKLVKEYVYIANKKAFGFDILDQFDVQYTVYHGNKKGYYAWHKDNNFFTDGFFDRKLTFILQLTDAKDYTGGKFEIDLNGEILHPEGFDRKGSILVFPAFYRHRVTPVTKGIRKSLVSWMEGPHFK
jgi:PKHD-type hydroxylase